MAAEINWLRKLARVLIVPLLLIFPLTFFAWSTLGGSNPIPSALHTLTSNADYRDTAGKYFVSKMSESATGEEKKLLVKKGGAISSAVTELLGKPELEAQLDSLSQQAFDYYTGDQSKSTSLDFKPLARFIINDISSVDSSFKKLNKEVNKIEPAVLNPEPIVHTVRGIISTAFYVDVILILLLIVGFYFGSRNIQTMTRWLGIQFIYTGAIAFIVKLSASSILSSQLKTLTDDFARSTLNLLSGHFLSVFNTLGGVLLGAGAVLLGLSFQLGKISQNRA